jgi:hypothetical protein
MATKFSMRSKAHKTLKENQQRQVQLVETLLILHNNDFDKTRACMEGIVEILGSVVARLNAGKNPFDQIDTSQEQRAMLGIIAGAKTLMDHPEAIEGHNLTPNKLRAVITQAGANMDATKMLHQVAKSAPDVTSNLMQMFQRFNKAAESGNPQAAAEVKQAMQQLWLHWQKNMPKNVPAPAKPAPTMGVPAHMGRA